MTDSPRVSIVVLNYNRKDLLRRCLRETMNLDWSNLEWIVVDNASTDGSCQMVQEEFGDRVRVIARTANSVTEARNDGFAAASGEIILSIDNDIYLYDKQIIHKAMELLNQFPEVGLLAARICEEENPDRHMKVHWWHPVSQQAAEFRFFYTTYFTESCVFLRRSAFEATGGYEKEFFRGVEQIDLALKLIREGYMILYCPNLVCVEWEARGQLANVKSPIHYLNMRNKLWSAWLHYPIGRAMLYGGGRILASGFRAVRKGWIGFFLKGVRDGIFAPAVIRAKRNPLPTAAWKKIDRIHRGWFVEVNPETARSSGS